jgi:hypothetical protein
MSNYLTENKKDRTLTEKQESFLGHLVETGETLKSQRNLQDTLAITTKYYNP